MDHKIVKTFTLELSESEIETLQELLLQYSNVGEYMDIEEEKIYNWILGLMD
jgi:hypothetical protein